MTKTKEVEADLVIKNLHVSVEGKEILKGLNLELKHGEVQALMGPNGSGKSTLAFALMGHPKYEVTKGEMIFKGKKLNDLKTNERAELGVMLSFQYPSEIAGVTVSNFLRTAASNRFGKKLDVFEFSKLLGKKMQLLKIDPTFRERYLNQGFSGGEKKRLEILQLMMLQPQLAVLDETDSGLDIDALKTVSDGVNALIQEGTGVLLITHYQRILNYVKPSKVHVLHDGRIVKSGGPELVDQLEKEGYDWIIKEDAEPKG